MSKMALLRKFSLGVGALGVIFSLSGGTVFAQEGDGNQSSLKNEITQKSNADFDQFLTNFVEDAKDSNKNANEIKNDLSKLGIEFNAAPAASIGILSNLPSNVSLTAYSARRGTEAFYRLYGSLAINSTMTGSQGSLDLLSIEWDPAIASYYGYADEDNAGYNFTSLMDYSNKDAGGLAFNVEDTRMSTGNSTYAVAYVKPKSGSSGKTLQFGAKYIHTYNDTGVTWKIGGNVGYEKGMSGGVTLELSPTSTSEHFNIAAQNAIQGL